MQLLFSVYCINMALVICSVLDTLTVVVLFWVLQFSRGEPLGDLPVRVTGSHLTAQGWGRVEVYYLDAWRPVTASWSAWTRDAARGVCNDLHLPVNDDSGYDAMPPGYFGPRPLDEEDDDTGGIGLRLAWCPPNVTSLRQCGFLPGLQNDFDDASVICYAAFRLGGAVSSMGLLERFSGSPATWNPVCVVDWTEENSKVACRSVGFDRGTLVEERPCGEPAIPNYGITKALRCTGEEESLEDCPWLAKDCDHCHYNMLELSCSLGTPEEGQQSTFITSILVGAMWFVAVIFLSATVCIICRTDRGRKCFRLPPISNTIRTTRRSRRWLGTGQARSPQRAPGLIPGQSGAGSCDTQDSRHPITHQTSARRSRDHTQEDQRVSSIYQRLEEPDDSPPPAYSPIYHPTIEIPIVGREEFYENGTPGFVENDALEYFEELDVNRLVALGRQYATQSQGEQRLGDHSVEVERNGGGINDDIAAHGRAVDPVDVDVKRDSDPPPYNPSLVAQGSSVSSETTEGDDLIAIARKGSANVSVSAEGIPLNV